MILPSVWRSWRDGLSSAEGCEHEWSSPPSGDQPCHRCGTTISEVLNRQV